MLPIQKYILRQYKGCASKRNIAFLLSDDQALAIMDCTCVYCGEKHSNTAIRSQYAVKEFRYNSIDRVNSDLPYDASNTVACCNAAKSDMPIEVFLTSGWIAERRNTLRQPYAWHARRTRAQDERGESC